ncbi:hypothetical protein GGX14DRAFT_395833 [Mycena pura]|uniref:Uncharacterized protein n=1 Tax=Mycena pura TaxID=153505 RepID=A0AAD6VJG9_9AGAR|nr:hypothetical protein GGX14DRAFT_395833 [Mycena pura]
MFAQVAREVEDQSWMCRVEPQLYSFFIKDSSFMANEVRNYCDSSVLGSNFESNFVSQVEDFLKGGLLYYFIQFGRHVSQEPKCTKIFEQVTGTEGKFKCVQQVTKMTEKWGESRIFIAAGIYYFCNLDCTQGRINTIELSCGFPSHVLPNVWGKIGVTVTAEPAHVGTPENQTQDQIWRNCALVFESPSISFKMLFDSRFSFPPISPTTDAASSAGAANIIGNFGSCSVPQIQFGAGFNGRTESALVISPLLQFTPWVQLPPRRSAATSKSVARSLSTVPPWAVAHHTRARAGASVAPKQRRARGDGRGAMDEALAPMQSRMPTGHDQLMLAGPEPLLPARCRVGAAMDVDGPMVMFLLHRPLLMYHATTIAGQLAETVAGGGAAGLVMALYHELEHHKNEAAGLGPGVPHGQHARVRLQLHAQVHKMAVHAALARSLHVVPGVPPLSPHWADTVASAEFCVEEAAAAESGASG